MEMADLGTVVPFCWTSQHRTWLSQEVATRWLAVGLKCILLTVSAGGMVTSMSLLGLTAPAWAAGATAPNVPPKDISQAVGGQGQAMRRQGCVWAEVQFKVSCDLSTCSACTARKPCLCTHALTPEDQLQPFAVHGR